MNLINELPKYLCSSHNDTSFEYFHDKRMVILATNVYEHTDGPQNSSAITLIFKNIIYIQHLAKGMEILPFDYKIVDVNKTLVVYQKRRWPLKNARNRVYKFLILRK
jgi:hypothetical protein